MPEIIEMKPGGANAKTTRSHGPRKRPIVMFRNRDASEVDETMMRTEGVTEAIATGLTSLAGHGLEQAQRIRCLFRQPGPNACSLVHVWFKSGFVLPPHAHNADCTYYIIAGEIHLGKRVLGAGDGMFIPAGVTYAYTVGPAGVELLEFRNASTFNIVYAEGPRSVWQRMVDAAQKNAEAWKHQSAPPARTVP